MPKKEPSEFWNFDKMMKEWILEGAKWISKKPAYGIGDDAYGALGPFTLVMPTGELPSGTASDIETDRPASIAQMMITWDIPANIAFIAGPPLRFLETAYFWPEKEAEDYRKAIREDIKRAKEGYATELALRSTQEALGVERSLTSYLKEMIRDLKETKKMKESPIKYIV